MVEDDPLEIQFDGNIIGDIDNLKLGTLIASLKESDDWHDYTIFMTNNSRNDLVGITLQTNLSPEFFQSDIPKQLNSKEGPVEAHIKIRASKMLKAELQGKPYLFFKYKEAKHY